jgi:hypothetical protein
MIVNKDKKVSDLSVRELQCVLAEQSQTLIPLAQKLGEIDKKITSLLDGNSSHRQ